MTKNLKQINGWFRSFGSLVLRFRWLVLLIYLIVFVAGIAGFPKIILNSSYDKYFPEDDPFQVAKDEFEEIFGNNNDAMLLVEADDVFDPEILGVIRELSRELEKKVPWAEEVVSLTEFEFTQGTEEGLLIEPLVPEVVPTDPVEIEKIRSLAMSKQSFKNRLVSDDSKMTWVVIRLRSFPEDYVNENKETAEYHVGGIVQGIVNSDKYKNYSIKASGMPVLTYDKTNIFKKEMQKSMMSGLIIAFVILALFLRTAKGVLVPLLTMISSIAIVYGFMGHFGVQIDSSMMTIPILLGLGLSIGYSIHVFNFFNRHFIKTGNRKESVLYAVEHTGWALMFTAITTVVSLLSFYTVPITITHWLGGTGASLVFVIFSLVITLTPIFLSFGKDRLPVVDSKSAKMSKWDNYLKAFGGWVLGKRKAIIFFFIVVISIFAYGITKLEVSMNWPDTFGFRVPYIERMWYVGHTKIGSLFNYNIALDFKEYDSVKDPEVLKKFDEFSEFCASLEKNKRVSSILDILKDMNQVVHENDEEYYRVPEQSDMVSQLLFLYETSGGSQAEEWVDYDYTTLRMMIEVEEFDAAVYNKNYEQIKAKANELFPDAVLGLTGTVAQFAVIINYIAMGEIYSFLTAMVVISLLMMIVFRSVKTGLIGMIPNLTPAIIIGGLMGWLGIPLDMMKMMIMPLLLGIAVDDTIHFINHAKYEIQDRNNYTEGILQTFGTVGKALFMTTIIISASFAIYSVSIIKALVHLGVFLSIGLVTALIADFLMTPVLIKMTRPFKIEKQVLSDKKVA